MRKFIAAVLLTFCATAVAADIYTWRDQDGVVHFGDEAPPGAEKVELPPPTVYTAPPLTRAQPAPSAAPAAAPAYNAAAIGNPGPEETVRNATGTVSVSVALDPPLGGGHSVRLLLDGNAVGEPMASTQFTLRGVNRGAHTLTAEVLGADGRVLIRTGSQTFFLHRPSALH